MVDRWTDLFYWPALIGAWLALLPVLAVAIGGSPLDQLVWPATILLAVFAAILFLLVLLDAPTRRSVEALNGDQMARRGEISWAESFFSPRYGDQRLLFVNRLAWIIAIIGMFTGRTDLLPLCFVSFALSTLMALLMLKRERNPTAP